MVYNKIKQAIRKMMSAKHKSWKERKSNNLEYINFVKDNLNLKIDIGDSVVNILKDDDFIFTHQYDSIFNSDLTKKEDIMKFVKFIDSAVKRVS